MRVLQSSTQKYKIYSALSYIAALLSAMYPTKSLYLYDRLLGGAVVIVSASILIVIVGTRRYLIRYLPIEALENFNTKKDLVFLGILCISGLLIYSGVLRTIIPNLITGLSI